MLAETAVNRATADPMPQTSSWQFNGVSRGLLSVIELSHRSENFYREQADSTEAIPLAILREILSALHFRDENTFNHSRRVGLIAMGIAQQLCWEKDNIKQLEIAALLHDIGKIGIPDHLLYKPGRFSAEDFGLMSHAVEVAEDILQSCRLPLSIRRTVLEARRYYSGLEDYSRPVGTELSQGARILAVADAYESLSREQVFRDAKDHHDITDFLKERAGTQYDPRVVETLCRWLDNGGLSLLRSAAGKDSSFIQSSQNGSLMMGAIGTVFAELYALEQAYDGFSIIDADRNVLLVNRGCQQLFGRTGELFEPQPWTPELFPITNFNHQAFGEDEYPLDVMLAKRRPMSVNVQIRQDDRHFEAAEVQCFPLFDVDGLFRGVAEFYKCKDRTRHQSHQFKELALQASRDALTGIANRGELENQLANIMDRYLADPQGSIFSVIYLDIDHFKSINDNYGHAVGDEVLVELAKLLRQEAYSNELAARYGGEEFVVLCPELELMQAAGRAERFRLEIAKLRFKGAPDLRITSSFGVAQIESQEKLDSVLKRADKALYESKKNGRNRTTVLRREELSQSLSKVTPAVENEDFVFKAELAGVLYDEFLIMKMKSFVHDNNAKVRHVTKGEVLLQLGKKKLGGRWGKDPSRQPVLIEMKSTNDERSGPAGGRKQKLQVKITPIGTVKKREVFQDRARHTYRMLRTYFVSE